jgi:magnesium chelatase family protein
MKNLVNRLRSASLDGLNAKVVEVESSFTKGLPAFSIVGLVSSDIQEAKERAKSALVTTGFELPPLKITINLSPSDIKKSGTHFDLAIALMIALHKEEIAHKDIFIFGELGLDGRVRSSSLIFPLILSLKEQGLIDKAIVPKDALAALKHIDSLNLIGVDNLKEAVEILKGEKLPKKSIKRVKYSYSNLKIDNQEYYFLKKYPLNFLDVKGQAVAIRGALISAAGMHNILLNGSPGSGKSMIAKRLRYILPPLSSKEILSIAKSLFLDQQEPDFKPLRPFRAPHHSATQSAIFGGGSYRAKIGEVALANYGVLFFDELPYFNSKVLEALREPMQDRVINIARVNSKITYDANFLFIGAMNPCLCGNLLSNSKLCRCSDFEIKRYKSRLSEPFLDRIELFVTMQEVNFSDNALMSSEEMHQKVIDAFIAQKRRGQSSFNGKLNEQDIDRFITLDREAESILEQAAIKFSLSFRSIGNVKKVARTIADLNANERVTKRDILEALSYRRRD